MNPVRRMPFVEKLFVWSVVLEPMLYFVLAERTVTGVGGNVSRLLQLLTLLGLGIRAVATPIRIARARRDPAASGRLYRPHAVYFLLAVAAGLIGWYTGAYTVPSSPNTEQLSFFSGLLNSPAVRPLFEYFIAAYYFIYFVVLPQFLLTSSRKLDYFLAVFAGMYMLSFVVGYVDFVGIVLGAWDGLPRHMLEGRTVGVRYHGFAGEPRDAFVFLFFGLAMLHLRAYYQRRGPLSRLLVAGIVLAMAFTQSASGLVGLGMGVGLVLVYTLTKISLKQVAVAAGLAMGAALFAVLTFFASARLQDYADNGMAVWTTLEAGGSEFGLFSGQMPSIFPLYDLYLKVRSFDWLPVIIGSGMGSASAVNNRYLQVVELANPASQIVRMLYEVGLLGLLLFIASFVKPVRYLTRGLSVMRRRQFLMLMLLLLGCFLGHRSSTLYIYLGAVMCVFRVLAAEPRLDAGTPAPARP